MLVAFVWVGVLLIAVFAVLWLFGMHFLVGLWYFDVGLGFDYDIVVVVAFMCLVFLDFGDG